MSDSKRFKTHEFVEYITEHNKKPDGTSWKGSTGVIIDPSCPGWYSHEVCHVEWLTGDLLEYQRVHKDCRVYSWHMKSLEIPYDPTQMGDREDDI